MDREPDRGLRRVPDEAARGGIEITELQGVSVPFARAELMLKMKKGARDKDAIDRGFLQQLIKNRTG